MYIIAGLGNPGARYAHTRHNAGFDAIDDVAEKYHIDIASKKHRALIGKGVIAGQKVILAKPQTFMNLSGESIAEMVHYYKLDPARELIVIYDDIALDAGMLRIRSQGSAGGHNGVKSIIACLNTQEFLRVKIGVGDKPPKWDLAEYVLAPMSKEDRAKTTELFSDVADALELLVNDKAAAAMCEYNKKKGVSR